MIDIEEKANSKEVFKVLLKLKNKMGVPLQIVSDNESALKKAVEILQEDSPSIIRNYDITHKTAVLLKHYLKDDNRWKLLAAKTGTTKKRARHSDFACFTPPKARDKARWLNLEVNVKWVRNMILYKKSRKRKVGRPSKESIKLENKFNEIFGWIDRFEKDIETWELFLEVLKSAKNEVKLNGLSKKTVSDFKQRTKSIGLGNCIIKKLKKDLVDFFKTETALFLDDKPYLGSSDIIESVFGKYKIFSSKAPLKELGKSILTIPVLTSEISHSEVKEAMEEISDKKLKEWLRENIGESLLSKRKAAFKQSFTKSWVNLFDKKMRFLTPYT